MKRAALYSRRSVSGQKNPEGSAVVGESAAPSGLEFKASRMRQLYERLGWLALGALFSLSMLFVYDYFQPARTELTQEQIDAAVLHTLATKELPARAARAAALIAPSIVRIRGDILEAKGTQVGDDDFGVGTGVVIKDDGTILTNFHVIAGAKKLKVTFFDGSEAEAIVIGVQPEKDLAVIKPQKIPDDLEPAVLGSSQQLLPGDQVVVVGFPFGIGPSVSAGVVSGLNRQFKSPDGNQSLSGLIQFDAAANPGNSGGPLVNMSGEVIGIVTAILNPTSARTFIGIGFATTIESAGSAVGLPPF